ncbi:MAG TPA: glutathione S-transferase N-terminal domain-containing protein [Candidatus Acidoferrales bacterium]|nr:glutathione S-transferase N-terminal domain-containing protein [Candidatus Acidoferrales bacterium]
MAALHRIDVVTSFLSTLLGLGRGMMAQPAAIHTPPPAQPLRLYDMEGCPFCRAAREALSALHLDAEILPCPKGGTRFRPEVVTLGGKAQFPYLVDPNTGVRMYESEAIVEYLFRTYAGGAVPLGYRGALLKQLGNALGSLVRAGKGIRVRASRAPAQPLHLWSFEASPYCRLVRERLTELELPYMLHNLAKEQRAELGRARQRHPPPYVPVAGGKRAAHFARTGHMQVPYLEDPNTGVQLLESADILDYLDRTYAA